MIISFETYGTCNKICKNKKIFTRVNGCSWCYVRAGFMLTYSIRPTNFLYYFAYLLAWGCSDKCWKYWISRNSSLTFYRFHCHSFFLIIYVYHLYFTVIIISIFLLYVFASQMFICSEKNKSHDSQLMTLCSQESLTPSKRMLKGMNAGNILCINFCGKFYSVVS